MSFKNTIKEIELDDNGNVKSIRGEFKKKKLSQDTILSLIDSQQTVIKELSKLVIQNKLNILKLQEEMKKWMKKEK